MQLGAADCRRGNDNEQNLADSGAVRTDLAERQYQERSDRAGQKNEVDLGAVEEREPCKRGAGNDHRYRELHWKVY
ncbi:MAG: hypothetical protein FJ194_04610 [Gammaproteobacteria bacterium]|nr:hypothetical protein [Gammaproteobacteria bacterium]